ncbi:MAG: hypothetical protein LRZ87_03565 [Methanocellales archaeon]|nr:hypothetical protein [Methanocellales archaeon]
MIQWGLSICESFDAAMKKVYEDRLLPRGTRIKISKWKDHHQIEIYGAGEDGRCAFCEYFVQMLGEGKTKRYNCPFH